MCEEKIMKMKIKWKQKQKQFSSSGTIRSSELFFLILKSHGQVIFFWQCSSKPHLNHPSCSSSTSSLNNSVSKYNFKRPKQMTPPAHFTPALLRTQPSLPLPTSGPTGHVGSWYQCLVSQFPCVVCDKICSGHQHQYLFYNVVEYRVLHSK